MDHNVKLEVQLWSDGSQEANKLCQQLTNYGYEVISFFSGSAVPKAFSQGQYSTGYSGIYLDYCLDQVSTPKVIKNGV